VYVAYHAVPEPFMERWVLVGLLVFLVGFNTVRAG
jgi:hypothetical protein